VERVARVLERLGDADIDDPYRLVEEGKQKSDRLGYARVCGPEDQERRGVEVGYSRTLAQEFRAMAAPMVMSVPASPAVSVGTTTSSTVPGGTVLRMTTLW